MKRDLGRAAMLAAILLTVLTVALIVHALGLAAASLFAGIALAFLTADWGSAS